MLEDRVFGREGGDGVAEGLAPFVSDARKWRVERVSQSLDDWRKRVAVVLILAASKAVTRHDDAAAEVRGVFVSGSEFTALFGREERTGCGVAGVGDFGFDARPVERCDFCGEIHDFTFAGTVLGDTPICIAEVEDSKCRFCEKDMNRR